MTIELAARTAAEERLARAETRRRLSEVELFEAHGLAMVDVIVALRRIPRRRCPCAGHRPVEGS